MEKKYIENSTFDSLNCLIKFNLMQIIQVVENAMRFHSLIMLIHSAVVPYFVFCISKIICLVVPVPASPMIVYCVLYAMHTVQCSHIIIIIIFG